MPYPIEPPVHPMLARLQDKIPRGDGWLYEPKWDGFRAIVFRDGEKVHIGSRNSLPLERYFPEMTETLKEAIPKKCVLDGEIVIAGPDGLDFDALQLRIHPAASRVNMLAEQMPSTFIAFDLLALGNDLRERPLSDRCNRLRKSITTSDHCFITPQTEDPSEAELWFDQFEGAGLDGVVAKRADLRYVSGERVMMKIKHLRTADCVVGGYRLSKDGNGIGSLLLGLYDGDDIMHFVGFTSSFKAAERRELLQLLKPLEKAGSFEGGRMPGAPSRWSGQRDSSFYSLEPRLVCEVAFDHMQGDRFRHGTRFLRWRTDKPPEECNYDQLAPPRPFSLEEIRKISESV